MKMRTKTMTLTKGEVLTAHSGVNSPVCCYLFHIGGGV